MMKLTLFRKLLLAFALLVPAPILILNGVFESRVEALAQREMIKRVTSVTENFAYACQPLMLGDQKMLEELGRRYLNEPDLILIRLLDREQKFVLNQFQPEFRQYLNKLKPPKHLLANQIEVVDRVFMPAYEYLEVTLPVTERVGKDASSADKGGSPLQDSVVIGTLVMGFSKHQMRNEMSEIHQMTTRWTLTVGILGILLAGVLSLWLVQPLRMLQRGTTEIAEGHFNFRVPETRHDEIGDLARAFNHMSERLRQVTVSRNYYETVLNAIHDAVFVVDRDGLIRTVNPQALQLLGYREEELLDQPFENLKRKESALAVHAEDEQVELLAKDSRRIPVHFRQSTIFHTLGDFEGRVCIASDITERKRFESELARAKQEAEAATKAKSIFLANMSHEIRTPMNGIIGSIQLLDISGLTARQRDCIETIKLSGETLLTIINDILDISKIESGMVDFHLDAFELRSCLEGVISLLAPKFKKQGLELVLICEPKLPSHVKGDAVRLRQVLFNLLGNAVKFTEMGQVSLRVSREWSDRSIVLRFDVIDTGIGIPQEKLGELFQPFYQIDNGSRRWEGTGLGLSISKALIERMGGEIRVKSRLGEGSHFQFTVQLQEADPTDPSNSLESSQQEGVSYPTTLSGPILLKGTNRDQLEGLEFLLKDLGAKELERLEKGSLAAWWVERGQEQRRPALILIDSPKELEAELRQFPSALSDVPLLLLLNETVEASLEVAELAQLKRVVQLEKPVRKARLCEALEVLLQGPRGNADPEQKAPKESASSRVDVPTDQRAGKAILLVEDSPTNQVVIRLILEKLGYGCDLAESGQEAVTACQNKRYDLILMDIQMPEMDGIEATQRIRAENRAENRPRIIALTASAQRGDRERFLSAGMDDYLAKPIDIEKLRVLLKQELGE